MRAITRLLFLFFVANTAFGQYDLVKLEPPRKNDCGASCTLSLHTKQPAPDDAKDEANWRVTAQDSKTKQLFHLHLIVKPAVSGTDVTLTFDRSQISSQDLKPLVWKVAYIGASGVSVATTAAASSASGLKSAKDRTDADLYASGTFSAGQGTKPLYVLDMKANIVKAISRNQTKAGVTAEVLTNTGTEVPVNRTEVDPDSIKAALTLQGLHPINGPFDGLFWDFRPVAGEFARKYPESNITTEGSLRSTLTPQRVVKTGFFWFTPKAGYEIGHNLNKPSQLFKRPVDLQNYNVIARALVAADVGYVLYAKGDDPKLQITASYQGRLPFTDEPFTTVQDVPDASGKIQRVQVVDMRSNMRHFTKNALTWNVTQLVGITFEHHYGALPPLFQMVRNQISVGLVFKAKL
ncbi:MAG TPA: hypothetical protein VJW20_11395 [Candidatus Angelobacter sp.]|nr:hypothetical protein [Candidatus Angelobacter sp.]